MTNHTTTSRYSGVCPECGGRWQPGDQIMLADQEAAPEKGGIHWRHAVCPDDAPWPDGPYPMACGICWLVHPVGACDR